MSFLKKNITPLYVCVFSMVAFCFLSILSTQGTIHALDRSILKWISVFERPELTHFMVSLSFVFHPAFLFLLFCILFAALLVFKKRKKALFLLLTLVAGTSSAVVLKSIFSVERPISTLAQAFGPSFPSTHATAGAIFFLSLFYIVRHAIQDRVIRFLFEIVAIVMVIMIGVSRMYLSVHWPTDVLAGLVLGLFWVSFGIIFLKKGEGMV